MKKHYEDEQEKHFISLVDFSFCVGYKAPPGEGALERLLKSLKDNTLLNTFKYQGGIYLDKEDVCHFQSEHISFNKIISNCNISPQQIRKLTRKYTIPFISFGQTYDHFFMKKKDVNKYIYDERLIDSKDIISMLGIDKLGRKKLPRSTKQSVIDNIKKDQELCELLGYIEVKNPLFFKNSLYPQVDVFEKEKVTSFFESHIATRKILHEFNMQRSNLTTMLKTYNIPMYTFYANHKFKFISNHHYYFLKELKKIKKIGANSFYLKNDKYRALVKSRKYYTKSQVRVLLNLSEDIFPSVMSEYNLRIEEVVTMNGRNTYFFSKAVINSLLQQQKELKELYENKYYTIKQVKEIYNRENIEQVVFYAANQGDIEAIRLPPILKGILAKQSSSTYLYKKIDVKNCIKKYEQDREMSKISLDTPFLEFLYKTETVLNVTFSEKLEETKTLWYQFVKLQLNNTTTINISSYINQLSRTSELLLTLLSKEIFSYSVDSLNMLFFNENSTIPISYRRIIYDFCLNVAKSLNKKLDKPRFQIKLLNNPHNLKEKRKIEKSRYSLEEYQLLYKYSSDLSIHKLEAIKDVESLLNGGKYNNYDSFWVYILTHLTNNWRHSTIISQIPEINLDKTNIRDLNWLKENDLSIEEANSIIFQIGRKIHKISKTGAEIEFRIAEPLKIPFATAISICQIRANAFPNENPLRNKETGPLLGLSIKGTIRESYQVYKIFFRGFIPNFHFSNRKMNRTLATLIWSVHKSLKVAQVSRGHFSEESTMYYIKLDDNQIHDLVNQLFERNSFGYLTHLLTQKLFDCETLDKDSETKKMLGIYKKFGDIHKLEVTTGLLNIIAKQQEDVLNFANGLSQDEIRTVINKSMTNTLYSKKKDYQCVFTKCKFAADVEQIPNCISCPYSIINVYALSNLMNLYLSQIQNLIQKFDSARIGEKHKMANHFYLLWRQIQIAKMRFGDVVYDFVDGGKKRFDHLAKQLPKTKKYLTNSLNSTK